MQGLLSSLGLGAQNEVQVFKDTSFNLNLRHFFLHKTLRNRATLAEMKGTAAMISTAVAERVKSKDCDTNSKLPSSGHNNPSSSSSSSSNTSRNLPWWKRTKIYLLLLTFLNRLPPKFLPLHGISPGWIQGAAAALLVLASVAGGRMRLRGRRQRKKKNSENSKSTRG